MNNDIRGRQVAIRQEREDRGEPKEDSPPWWAVGLGVAVGVAAVAGGIYAISQAVQQQSSVCDDIEEPNTLIAANVAMENIPDVVSRLSISSSPRVNNLNSLLNDLHARFVAVRKEDLGRHYDVFMKVIYPLHDAMKEVDVYYNRYSSRMQFAGSHYDRLRIKKPDEFDMDIVIGLPVNLDAHPSKPDESDILIEPKQPGFVQLRAGVQYQNILTRDGAYDSYINRQAYLWLDDKKYIQRSKFIQWFQGVVDRALNKFQRFDGYPCVIIDGDVYRIHVSSSGPAYTLVITNSAGFRLDVDMVPALKFPERRWLGRTNKTYRDIPAGCSVDYWMVVPKPNKFGANSYDQDRSWRVAMHDQERKYIHNSFHLRQANRLLKKLRDAQQMDKIASYYIKTLFLWKISELTDPQFWQRDVATIFKVMLQEFYKALVDRKISYFWNKKHNMIEKAPENIIKGYANKLRLLITKLEDDRNYMWAAKYLLTGSEYAEYEKLLAM